MKTYSGLQALYMSFFSKDLYRDVVRNWKGIAFLYLFLLIMASWLLVSFKLYFVLSEAVKGPVAHVVEKLPAVSIKDGELKLDKESPYVLTLNSNESMDPALKRQNVEITLAVFDATTDDVKGHEDVPFIITKHNFLIQSKDGKAQQIELKQFGDVQYTRASYMQIAEMVQLWVPILVFCICGPVSFILCAIVVLILGAIGMAVAGGSNIKLTYGEALRIASVAFTPAVILDTIIKLSPLPQSAIWPLIGFLAAIGYTIFGVMANKQAITVEDSMPVG